MLRSLARWSMGHRRTLAINRGLASSGRVITAAATVMIVVFGSFALNSTHLLKLIGLTLASAVLLDAFVVRTFLLPALLQLLGPRAWWFPRWLARRLPALHRGTLIPEPGASDPAA